MIFVILAWNNLIFMIFFVLELNFNNFIILLIILLWLRLLFGLDVLWNVLNNLLLWIVTLRFLSLLHQVLNDCWWRMGATSNRGSRWCLFLRNRELSTLTNRQLMIVISRFSSRFFSKFYILFVLLGWSLSILCWLSVGWLFDWDLLHIKFLDRFLHKIWLW